MQDSSYRIVLVQSCRQVQEGYDVKTDEADFTLKDFVVKKGSSFWSVDDDFEAIYDSFNILSYFSPSCKIRIRSKTEKIQKQNYGPSYQFSFSNKNQIYTLLQKERQLFSQEFLKNSENKQLKISYGINQGNSKNKETKWNIKVLFSIRKQKLQKQKKIQFLKFNNKKSNFSLEREQILIDIFDSDGWIKQNFLNVLQLAHHKRVSQFLKPRLGQVEYFYQEPENLRCKIIQKQHISLALQGGGCKGVQYIGAYKAILQTEIPIKSVIGSSAGGIIGLAVCCGLQPYKIIYICTNKLSKIAKDQKYGQINDEEEQKIEMYYVKLIELVKDLNIFDENLYQVLIMFLQDPELKKLLLELIRIVLDPEVAKLFAFTDNPDTLNLEGLLNAALMTGEKIRQIASEILEEFLNQKIRNKKENSSQYFHIRNFQEYQNLFNKNKSMGGKNKQIQKKMTQIRQKLTMAQLYQLNNVQFTCTAVDLDDHILRFFNKKTTPNLPVCYAVQMTGSFPFAFEAQRWKQQWGKYLIHYENIRRQIDLTNHRFTDGGTLSNFPIKYLDNQEMRPMYFSHAKTQETKMYGIGFREEVTKNPEKQTLKENKFNQIQNLFRNKVSKIKTLWEWCKGIIFESEPKKTQVSPAKIIEIKNQIPLIEFAWNLLETYSKTKDNLMKQCFAHVIFDLKASNNYRKQIKQRVRPKSLKDQINNLISLVEKLANQNNNVEEIYSSFKANLDYFGQNPLDFSCFEEKLCWAQRIVISNLESFVFYLLEGTSQFQQQLIEQLLANRIRKFKMSSENNNKKAIKELFNRIRQMTKEKIFVLCNIERDLEFLNQVNLVLRQFYQSIQQNPNKKINGFFKEALKKARKYEKKCVIQTLGCLREYFKSLDNDVQQKGKNNIASIIRRASKLPNLTLTLPIQKINQTLKGFMLQGVPQFFINAETLGKQDLFHSYVLKRINSQVRLSDKQVKQKGKYIQKRGLHIVLESAALSEIYFHKYMMLLKNSIFQYNQESILKNSQQINKIKVSCITVTGYQSLIVFLHATDLQDYQIEEEVWKLRYLVSIDKDRIEKKQTKLDWVKMTPILLRQLQRLAHAKQLDIFTYIETQISKKSDLSEIKQLVQSSIKNVELSRDDLIEAIDTSLNFVMSILVHLENSNDTSKNKVDELINQMALNTPQNYTGYQMGLYSQGLKSMCQFFFKKYKEIVKYISYSSPIIIDDVLRILQPEERKQAWKAAILPGVLQGKKIKQYVQDILIRLKLKPDTTLKQFYDLSKKKIQINLSVVEQSLVSILNRVTRPNMPVWAAILAAASIPQFYAPVLDKQQWKYRALQQLKLRKIKEYFQGEKKTYQFLSSSLALTTMPLDLLHNGQFRKKINFGISEKFDEQSQQNIDQINYHFEDSENQIFLVFSFQNFILSDLNSLMFTEKKQEKNQQYKFTITPFTLSDLGSNFVSFRSLIKEKLGFSKIKTAKQNINIEAMKNCMNFAPIVSKKKIFDLYVESHDNLIKNLYKKQLFLMPIKFSTLDFSLMISQETKGTDNENLSDICEDAIMQAYYAVKQKLKNSYQQKIFIRQKRRISYQKKEFAQEKHIKTPKIIEMQKYQIGRNKRTNNMKPGQGLFYKKSKRELYFRIESYMFEQMRQKNIVSNKIKIRFLSLLNTSREIYQQYFVYIGGFKQNKKFQGPLKQQAFILSQDLHEKITLKIEYPDPQKLEIRVSYFQLNLSGLFQLNSELKLKEKKRFGFVYCLNFDKFYSKSDKYDKQLRVFNILDFMNKSLSVLDYISIPIKSDIKQTIYEKIMCKDCVYPFKIHIKDLNQNSDDSQKIKPNNDVVQDIESQLYVECEKCEVRNPLNKHYLIQLDQKEDKLKCLLGHYIILTQGNQELKYNLCDLCGNGCFNSYWKDKDCQIQFCHNCRESNMAHL